MTSSIVITPTTTSLGGNTGRGELSRSRMQYEQPLCRFLKAGVAGGLFFACWAPSVIKESCDSNFTPIYVATVRSKKDNQQSRSTTKDHNTKECNWAYVSKDTDRKPQMCEVKPHGAENVLDKRKHKLNTNDNFWVQKLHKIISKVSKQEEQWHFQGN